MDIILQYTAPVWVALLSWLLFHEKIPALHVFVLFIAAAGTLCVCLSGGSLPQHAPPLAIFAGLMTGLCYASHFLITRFWQTKYSSA